MSCLSQNIKPTTTKYIYDGDDVEKFVKKIIRMLYDASIDDVIFIDGNNRNLSKNNVWVKSN
jgi:hypothetical protein